MTETKTTHQNSRVSVGTLRRHCTLSDTQCTKSKKNTIKLKISRSNIKKLKSKVKKNKSIIPTCKNQKKSKKKQMVDSIFKPDINGISEWKTREELDNTPLGLSKNGNCRYGKFYQDSRYIWEKRRGKGRKVLAIRTAGFDLNNIDRLKRPIRKDIREHHITNGCVVCGSRSDLIIDHKNDLYNDERVLKLDTQLISDFQCLCNHCNLQKRQVAKDTRKSGKRYKATNIKSLNTFGIDFISGDESFDPNDPNAMVGTYWYDPVAFMNGIKSRLMNSLS